MEELQVHKNADFYATGFNSSQYWIKWATEQLEKLN